MKIPFPDVLIQHINRSLKSIKVYKESINAGIYLMKVPATVVRITGKAPLQATVYQMERLRCNLCGEIFKAKVPAGIGEEKYDAGTYWGHPLDYWFNKNSHGGNIAISNKPMDVP